LPCFQPHDTGPRAGGFIEDRFLTGLRPQVHAQPGTLNSISWTLNPKPSNL